VEVLLPFPSLHQNTQDDRSVWKRGKEISPENFHVFCLPNRRFHITTSSPGHQAMDEEQTKVTRFVLSVIHGELVGKKLSLMPRKDFIEIYSHIARTFYFCIIRGTTSIGRAMEKHEEARLKYVLSCVHGDIVEGTLPPTGEEHREAFVDRYMKVAVGRKYVDGYTKSAFIMMEHDVDACHSEDFFWSAQGTRKVRSS
jgi:hypothetical protein